MKTYRVTLKTRSSLTRIPDSQSIFGTICNIIKNTQGEERLLEYFQSFNNQPWIINSSMFLEGIYPMIKKNLISTEFINKTISITEVKNKVETLKKFKSIKKARYISEKVLVENILSDNIEKLQADLINEKLHVQDNVLSFKNNDVFDFIFKNNLNTRVQIDSIDVENGENRELFYDQSLYFDYEQNYIIYIKSTFNINELEKIFKFFEFFPVGNRKSVGKNQFIYENIEEVNLKNNNSLKYLMSKYVPLEDEVNWDKSFYQLEHKNMRSGNTYLENELYGEFNVFLEGSLLKTYEDKEYYGRIIPFTINNKTIYYYGIGFIL